MTPEQQKSWVKIITAVKNPLTLSALAVLVLGSFFGALTVKALGASANLLAVAFIIGLVLVLGFFLLTKFFEAQRIDAQSDTFAAGLGEEIYTALDGSLRNLSDEERALAYDILRTGMESSPHVRSNAQRQFSMTLVSTIIRRAELTGREAKKRE